MLDDSCDKKPLVALWFLHKTTEELYDATGDDQVAALRLQKHWLAVCLKYGVTVDRIADCLDITLPVARELCGMAEEIK